MNSEETLTWAQNLLPEGLQVTPRRLADGFPEFALAYKTLDEPGRPQETVAMTLDAARIDPGLEAEGGADVRVELVTVTDGYSTAGLDLLAAAATMISQAPQVHSPQPGTLLPNVGDHAIAHGEERAAGRDGVAPEEHGLAPSYEPYAARHGLLAVPFIWPDGVPQVHEVTAPGAADLSFTHPGRLTVPAQLIMLTDEEFDIASSKGIDALQAHVVEQGINLNDLWR